MRLFFRLFLSGMLAFFGCVDAEKKATAAEVSAHFKNADWQDVFRITLEQGKNVLLVAVYQHYGGWSGFFGFETGSSIKFYRQED